MKVEELEYVEERGPGVADIPEQAPGGPELAGQAAVVPVYPGWDREAIDQFLKGTGAGIHYMIGAAEADWKMTEEDLERMGAPLWRIANRWEPALRLSPVADPLLFAHGAFLYAWRSMLERKRALYDAQDAELAAEGAAATYERAPAEPSANGAAPQAEAEDQSETYFPKGAANEQ
jgi:hypothetical protein